MQLSLAFLDQLSREQVMLGAATILAAIGLWLMLPRGSAPGRSIGMVLAAVSFGLFGALSPSLASIPADVVFWLLAVITIISAAMTVTARSPAYCAVWFALVLLATGGLMLFQGAQFLGVATVVVYAGAILVTFLFVLMLAQPAGHDYYDRISWEPLLCGATGAVLIGVLAMSIVTTLGGDLKTKQTLATIVEDSSEARDEVILAEEHVAAIGRSMFGRHLISVQVAGTMLLAALVGAVAIVAQGKDAPQVTRTATSDGHAFRSRAE